MTLDCASSNVSACVKNFVCEQFTEKRRELKFDGRMEKELSESYAFLMVDRSQVRNENTAGEMLSLAIKRFWGFGFFQSVFIDTIFFANFLQKLLLQNSALEGVEGWERDLIRHHLNSLFPAV